MNEDLSNDEKEMQPGFLHAFQPGSNTELLEDPLDGLIA
jgi:hypothetical protein